jgi:hypothetical protein
LEQQVLARVDIDIRKAPAYYLQKIVGMSNAILPLPARWTPIFTSSVQDALNSLLTDPAYIISVLRYRVWQVFPQAGLTRATFLLYFFSLTDALQQASNKLEMGPSVSYTDEELADMKELIPNAPTVQIPDEEPLPVVSIKKGRKTRGSALDKIEAAVKEMTIE